MILCMISTPKINTPYFLAACWSRPVSGGEADSVSPDCGPLLVLLLRTIKATVAIGTDTVAGLQYYCLFQILWSISSSNSFAKFIPFLCFSYARKEYFWGIYLKLMSQKSINGHSAAAPPRKSQNCLHSLLLVRL